MITEYKNLEQKLDALTELVTSGFGQVYERFEALEVGLDFRFVKTETRLGGLEDRMDRFEIRFDGLENRIDHLEIRFDDMDARFDTLAYAFHDTQRRQGKLELMQEDTADTVLNHEERIIRIELAGA